MFQSMNLPSRPISDMDTKSFVPSSPCLPNIARLKPLHEASRLFMAHNATKAQPSRQCGWRNSKVRNPRFSAFNMVVSLPKKRIRKKQNRRRNPPPPPPRTFPPSHSNNGNIASITITITIIIIIISVPISIPIFI